MRFKKEVVQGTRFKKEIIALCFCLLCTGRVAAQIDFLSTELLLLSQLVTQQVEQLKALEKEFMFFTDVYEVLEEGFGEELFLNNVQIWDDTFIQELVQSEYLNQILGTIEELKRLDSGKDVKENLLQAMRLGVQKLRDSQVFQNTVEEFDQYQKTYTWLADEIGKRESVTQQMQLLNTNMLEVGNRLTKILQSSQAGQRIQSVQDILVEEEKKLIDKRLSRFWGVLEKNGLQ